MSIIATKNMKTTVSLEDNLERCGFYCIKESNRSLIAIRNGFAYKFDVMVGKDSFDLEQLPGRLYMDKWFYAENGEVMSAFVIEDEWYVLTLKNLIEVARTRHHIGKPTIKRIATPLFDWLVCA